MVSVAGDWSVALKHSVLLPPRDVADARCPKRGGDHLTSFQQVIETRLRACLPPHIISVRAHLACPLITAPARQHDQASAQSPHHIGASNLDTSHGCPRSVAEAGHPCPFTTPPCIPRAHTMQTNGRSYGPISGLPGEYAYPTAYARAGIDYPAHGQSHSRSERGEREERSGGVDREGGRGDSGGYHWNVEDDRYQSGFERADYDYLDMERRGRDQGDRADEGGRHDPAPTYTHAGPAPEKHSEGGSSREYRAPASQPFNPKQPLRRNVSRLFSLSLRAPARSSRPTSFARCNHPL